MHIRCPSKAQVLCAFKIIAGCACAIATFSSGKYGCPPNIFCTLDVGYMPKLDLWSIGNALLAIALLVSALKDVLRTSEAMELLPRDIEAVADLDREHPDSDF